mgnify:CR=1 FL=1
MEALARRCRLGLPAEALRRVRADLTVMLDFLEILQTVDDSEGPTYTGAAAADSGLRADTPGPCLPVTTVLAAASDRRDDLVAVPRCGAGTTPGAR